MYNEGAILISSLRHQLQKRQMIASMDMEMQGPQAQKGQALVMMRRQTVVQNRAV